MGPRPRRAMGPQEAARVKRVEADGFAAHRLRRGLVAFGTSLALVLGVFGVLGMGSASAAPRSSLAVSLNPNPSSAVRLDSRTVQGEIYVFVRSQRGLEKVTFYLDDSWQSGDTRPDRVRAAVRLRRHRQRRVRYPFEPRSSLRGAQDYGGSTWSHRAPPSVMPPLPSITRSH